MGRHATVFKNAINPYNVPKYINGMVNDFGLKYTLLCVSNYFAIKGALNGFITSVQTKYWAEGGWNSIEYGGAATTARIPWSIKSFGGILSDLFPIFGYEKTSYMYIYTILGTISCLLLASWPMSKETTNIAIPTFFYLFLNFQTSFTDLLMEGKYVDLMKNNPNNKGNVISFTYFCVTLGSIIPAITVGFMSDSANIPARFQFFVYLPFAANSLIFLWYGCMVDDKAHPNRNNRFDFEKFNRQRHMTFMALLIGIVGTGTVVINLFASSTLNSIYNLSSGIILGIIMWFMLPSTICKTLYYVYIAQFSYINLESHLEFFYTLDDRCLANSPHFEFVYYKTWVGFVSTFASFIGLWLFQAVLCQYKYRPIFWTSTITRVFGSIFDIIIINRWNIDMGISDKSMYMFGSAILYPIAYQLDFMPICLICAKVCPKTVETMMFAIAASYANYGTAVGTFVGTYAVDIAGVRLLDGGPCNADNLGLVVFIGHCILPLCSIPFTFLLIPDRYVHENFADPEFDEHKRRNADLNTRNLASVR